MRKQNCLGEKRKKEANSGVKWDKIVKYFVILLR